MEANNSKFNMVSGQVYIIFPTNNPNVPLPNALKFFKYTSGAIGGEALSQESVDNNNAAFAIFGRTSDSVPTSRFQLSSINRVEMASAPAAGGRRHRSKRRRHRSRSRKHRKGRKTRKY